MIIFQNGSFQTRSDCPDTDWTDGEAKWVIPDGSEAANKILRLYPNCTIDVTVGEDGEQVVTVTEVEAPIQDLIAAKKKDASTACNEAITNGVDVGNDHYSLTTEDQANILAWMALAQTGAPVPYHADGQECRIFTAQEFLVVANAAVGWKTHHTTYCNLLLRQIEQMTDADEISAVQYGVTQLNEEYQARYNLIMSSLGG